MWTSPPGQVISPPRRRAPSIDALTWRGRVASSTGATQPPRWLSTRRLLRAGGYSIVHTHTPIASFVVRAAVASLPRRARPAVVYTAHGFHFAPGRSPVANTAFATAEWMAGRRTDRLVVINEQDLDAAQRLRLVPREHLVYMPGIGIDLDWYKPTPALVGRAAATRRSLGVPPEAPLLSIVAELTARKQHDVALQALALVGRGDVHLALAGDGPRRATLEARAANLGIADRVHFLGNVADARPLMLASRATVLPSFREGLSRSVLESLALGVPVVGSDIRGIADAVRPDGGFLVPPGDAHALAEALDRIIASPPLDETTRRRLRERLAGFSLEALIAEHDRLYASLVDERTRVGDDCRANGSE